ncbi:MAG: sensor histidine kinase [Ilumatobacteraceae bacterium]
MKRILRPWRSPLALWQAITFSALSLPIGIITFTFMVTLLALGAGLMVTFLLALPVIWLLFVMAHGFASMERSRVASLLGIALPDPVPPLTGPSWGKRLAERVRSKPRWREIGYHVAMLPTGVFAFAAITIAWCGPLAMVALPAVVGAFPGDSAKFYFFELHQGAEALGAALAGVVGLVLVSPWITVALARLQASMAQGLLGPDRNAAIAEQVRRAETGRTAAVDSAEYERRRIERDLHDGAQQRLVALAADLGAAREKLDTDPEHGREMVAAAHEEAKAALKEIRDLVRGIHPVILEDRGLDAALSAVVARAPVPVQLDVRVEPRPSPAVESAAYFVVNEALTNVARHSQATRAWVSIARAGDRLVVEVRDDGVGGADASEGTGLQGLRDRVTGLGGNMHVISPPGGPTTISVELPCGS